MPEIQTSFLCPFSYATLGEGEHNSGDQFSKCFGTRSSPTPPADPFPKPLIKVGIGNGNSDRHSF